MYLFAQSWKLVLGREMKEVQNGATFATDGAVEGIPNRPVNSVVDGVQAGNGDQRTGRTAQFGRKFKFLVVDHITSRFVNSIVDDFTPVRVQRKSCVCSVNFECFQTRTVANKCRLLAVFCSKALY